MMVGTDVPDANVVAHDYDDVGLLLRSRWHARYHSGGKQRELTEPDFPGRTHDLAPC
jgi:hypothetical protein